MKSKIILLISLFIFCTGFSASVKPAGNTKKAGTAAKQRKEFRAVWVASVANIDWPSKKGLSEEQQKREYLNILDNVKRWNMNAVVVQVKPTGDAFYPSKYGPWSEYLTGKQGVNPGYDPLKFMVEEAHKRGIEFHAWFNPYRLSMNTDRSRLSRDNIVFKKPEWIVEYGGKLYLDPGIPAVDDYVVDSIMEVVKNYDIDAVHMDDYFYPYKVKNQEYPDEYTYRQYGSEYNSKSAWRRDNVNRLVEKLSVQIKKTKPNVQFGISPFGVWRNKSTDPVRGSDTKAGVQNYDDLYADILLWIDKGWIDYVAPQIYWNQGFNLAEYNTLVRWWSDAVAGSKTDLYIGQAAYKVKEWKNSNELINQVYFNRDFSNVKGSIFFSYKSLLDNPKEVTFNLMEGPYKSDYILK